jgi:S1-C subfamily serine protease
MIDINESPTVVSERPQARFSRAYRRPALVAGAALALVIGVGGVARADETGASSTVLLTSSTNVATSVQGALVDIVSTDSYEGAVAAGTGMILTSTGEILTNNHVIDGATSIKVTVVATQKTYTATVVGTDPTADVAVIQLKNASGLKTVPLGDSSSVKVGQKVVATGNANGDGGDPSVVTGTVTALDQDITASDESGSDAEQLTGLIENDAPIVAGDSGGSLAIAGKVIGMNTAASVSNSTAENASDSTTSTGDSYAIPINTALSIAQQMVSGKASSTVHIGLHGFLGVSVQDASTAVNTYGQGGFGGYGGFDPYSQGSTTTTSGAEVSGVLTDGAAASAGLRAGDVITSVNGTSVDSVTALNTVMATTKPGQKVSVTWTDSSGTTQTATLTLGTAATD